MFYELATMTLPMGTAGQAAAQVLLAAHDDAALGEGNLPADLRSLVPPCLDDGRGDELDADVVFAQVVLHS